MKIKLDPWGRMPTQGHPESDAGWDLYAPEDVTIAPFECITIQTGVHVRLPRATGGLIVPRSSVYKRRIFSIGLIDPGYTGEIGITLINMGNEDFEIHKGDRVAQLVIMGVVRSSWELVDELPPSERGAGGFGSTGGEGMRPIDVDALLRELKQMIKRITPIEESRDMFFHDSGINGAMTGAILAVDKAPTIDAVPVVHGRWETYPDFDEDWGELDFSKCSVCGNLHFDEYRYCPSCGAKMDLEVDGDG